MAAVGVDVGTAGGLHEPTRLSGSVVIPAHNAAATLGAQLDALAGQEGGVELEVIVVANRCSDRTMEIAQSYREDREFPHELRVVRADERLGEAYARNSGFECASTPHVLSCDADDVVSPFWAYQLCRSLADADLVAGALAYWNPIECPDPSAMVNPTLENVAAAPLFDFLPFAPGGNHAVKRSMWEQVGGWDEGFAVRADVDFPWRVQLAGGVLMANKEAIVYYRQPASLGRLFAQARVWGCGDVQLFRKFKEFGMPKSPRSLLNVLNLNIYQLLTSFRLITSRRRKWILQTAESLGRIQGSIRHRSIYL